MSDEPDTYLIYMIIWTNAADVVWTAYRAGARALETFILNLSLNGGRLVSVHNLAPEDNS